MSYGNVIAAVQDLGSQKLGLRECTRGMFSAQINADCALWIGLPGNDYMVTPMLGIVLPAVNAHMNAALRRAGVARWVDRNPRCYRPISTHAFEHLLERTGRDVPPVWRAGQEISVEAAKIIAEELIGLAPDYINMYGQQSLAIAGAERDMRFGPAQKLLLPAAHMMTGNAAAFERYLKDLPASERGAEYDRYLEQLDTGG